jgi:von Willebrand factor type A domain
MKKYTDLSTTIAFSIRRLSLSVLIVGSLAYPSWGQTKQAEIVGNPTVNDDRVTIRVKVKNEQDRPVMGLVDTDFKLIVDDRPIEFSSKDWKSPEETTPPPAWIIVLLDFSGSMQRLDSRGNPKINGAINAVREFINVLGERAKNIQVSIVPFGEPSPSCSQGYAVNKNTLDKFLPAKDAKQQNHLDHLAGLTPCASTNLYEPLNQAIRFLGDTSDPRFYSSEESKDPQPRLSIILLSDGYHNQPNEDQEFRTLTALLKKNNNITVHTLGYGKTPEQLGKEYLGGKPATRNDIGLGLGKVPEKEFVDRKRLAEIANLTGGIAEFSGDADKIAENLQLFLTALLGEYEITYTEPNPERGSKHNVRVRVASSEGTEAISPPKPYTITVFGRSLPLNIRLTMLLSIFLMMTVGGLLPFYFWGQHLKRQALGD